MKERASERIEFINSDGTGAIFDISKTGIAFLYDKKVPDDNVIRIQLNDLKVDAKVIYSQERTDGYRLGAQFQNLTAADQMVIDEIVDNFSRGVPTRCRVVSDDIEKGR